MSGAAPLQYQGVCNWLDSTDSVSLVYRTPGKVICSASSIETFFASISPSSGLNQSPSPSDSCQYSPLTHPPLQVKSSLLYYHNEQGRKQFLLAVLQITMQGPGSVDVHIAICFKHQVALTHVSKCQLSSLDRYFHSKWHTLFIFNDLYNEYDPIWWDKPFNHRSIFHSITRPNFALKVVKRPIKQVVFFYRFTGLFPFYTIFWN